MSAFYMILIIISLLIMFMIISKVNKNLFFVSIAIEWLFVGVLIIISAIYPPFVHWISNLLGFELTSNFILFSSIIFLSYQILNLVTIATQQNKKITFLIQEVSILKSEVEKKEIK